MVLYGGVRPPLLPTHLLLWLTSSGLSPMFFCWLWSFLIVGVSCTLGVFSTWCHLPACLHSYMCVYTYHRHIQSGYERICFCKVPDLRSLECRILKQCWANLGEIETKIWKIFQNTDLTPSLTLSLNGARFFGDPIPTLTLLLKPHPKSTIA